ncbi:MAG: MBL fold metallo-hydrolase [Chloroflexi bacterium]|nr:MBL fold metallo-hydrolase [Chloroflexota bacterium]
MLKLWTLPVGEYGTNCYLLTCPDTGRGLLVDPGADAKAILVLCKDWHVTRILLTHGHYDHTQALDEVRTALEAPVGIQPDDAAKFGVEADFELWDGMRLGVGRHFIRLVHIPGHTPGSMALRFDQRAIVGDATFPGGPGHTADPDALQTALLSLQRTVFTWPDDTIFHSGHGDHGTVGDVRPAFQEFLARPRSADLCGDVTWS